MRRPELVNAQGARRLLVLAPMVVAVGVLGAAAAGERVAPAGMEKAKAMPEPSPEKVIEYLDFLHDRIVAERKLPTTLEGWKKRRKDLRRTAFRLVGLDPLPERTPLKPRFVGEPIEAERFTFRRVVFESRPKSYVACHLYVPRNVKLPAPAMIYAPSSTGRDNWKAIGSCCYYASNGFVVLAVPLIGGEGRVGATLSRAGGHGPYLGRCFHWYSTGYQPLGVVVWDTMRAVDYLLTLKDAAGGEPLVDKARIGIAGHSQGSHRSLWGAVADERIAVSVPVCGWRPVWKYRLSLHRSSDEGVLYNYCGITVAEIFALIAPRKLLVINGKTDKYFANPEGAERNAEVVRKVYALYASPESFENKMFDQGHTYSSRLMKSEHAWVNRWLRDGARGPGAGIPAEFWKKKLSERGKRMLDPAKLRCFGGSREKGWRLDGKPVESAHAEKQFTKPTPKWDVTSADDFASFKRELTKALREEVLRHAFRKLPATLTRGGARDRGGLREEQMVLTLEGKLSHRAIFLYKPGERRRTIVMLAGARLEGVRGRAEKLAAAGANVLVLEPTDVGATRQGSGKTRLHQLLRFAPQVGHTLSSLRVNDTLAAAREISKHKAVDPARIYVWGQGPMAVPALYAAAVSEKIAGVVLENAPGTHMSSREPERALLRILCHADMPQSAGLIFPRPVVLAGKKAAGYEWTRELYGALGKPELFVEVAGEPEGILGRLP